MTRLLLAVGAILLLPVWALFIIGVFFPLILGVLILSIPFYLLTHRR